jgi:hypothetical protein
MMCIDACHGQRQRRSGFIATGAIAIATAAAIAMTAARIGGGHALLHFDLFAAVVLIVNCWLKLKNM